MSMIGKWPRPPLKERLLSKIKKNKNGCWIWTGGQRYGYGTIWINGKNESAHWASLYIFNKSKTYRTTNKYKYVVDHLCRTPLCINPNHLEIVTPRENNLRGKSPAAINNKKTHCINGHEFTDKNIRYSYSRNRLYRQCKTCCKINSEKLRRKNGIKKKEIVTHCPKGHEYNFENTYITKNKLRMCKACGRLRGYEYRKKQKGTK